jgi:hypothetical protein
MRVVTRVVFLRSPWKMAARLGLLRVPAVFFSRHVGDSGRNGRMMMSGSAGMTPDMRV